MTDIKTFKHKVFVYGTLKQGGSNHALLKDSTLFTEYKTEAKYTMVSLGSFPGLIEHGNTPIHGEIYEVDSATLARLDHLEGYYASMPEHSLYLRETMATMYGDVYVYTLNMPDEYIIPTGKWITKNNKVKEDIPDVTGNKITTAEG